MSGLRDALQSTYDQHGRLTPELVVEAARPKGSPLHAYVFDRTPKEAAEAWYRHRAHELITSVKITVREAAEGNPPLRVRAWHAVRSEGPDSYTYESAEKVATDPFIRQLVLRDMEREWRSLYGRYQSFAEFLELVTADLKQAA